MSTAVSVVFTTTGVCMGASILPKRESQTPLIPSITSVFSPDACVGISTPSVYSITVAHVNSHHKLLCLASELNQCLATKIQLQDLPFPF